MNKIKVKIIYDKDIGEFDKEAIKETIARLSYVEVDGLEEIVYQPTKLPLLTTVRDPYLSISRLNRLFPKEVDDYMRYLLIPVEKLNLQELKENNKSFVVCANNQVVIIDEC